MNLVDSCGWLEYLTDQENAVFFASPLEDIENLLVPSICVFEVLKKVLQEKNEDFALQVIALMHQGFIAELDAELAIQSAKLSFELKLPLADSIILATAKLYNAVIWTQDKHFNGLENVRYITKHITNYEK
jgi:predicted nucleic acid-binding protein